jgi:hypothetical protein
LEEKNATLAPPHTSSFGGAPVTVKPLKDIFMKKFLIRDSFAE